MAQLDSNRIVHNYEDKEQRISHEVLLPIVAKLLEVLTCCLIDLDGLDMDRLVTDKSCRKPNRCEAPVPQELNEK